MLVLFGTVAMAEPSVLAFGSCNKQHKPQPMWSVLADEKPEAFFWMGDAVYPNRSDVGALESALAAQQARPEYRAFAASTTIRGTWDDHDLGVNDGGRTSPDLEARRRAFLDFVGAENTYSYHDVGRVRVILLDTRSFRDDHLIPSVGAMFRTVPLIGRLMPLLAAASRLVAGYVPYAYAGDVLGDDQWAWLEEALSTDAAFFIVVSSVQVATSNPSFESWGHFPKAKARLFQLFEDKRPNGLLVLSGDVHHAEILGTTTNACGHFVEVTSSGMTHTLKTSKLTSILFPPLLRYYSGHRPQPSDFATDLNAAVLRFKWDTSPPSLDVHVLGPTGSPILRTVSIRSCPFSSDPAEDTCARP